jgi:excisionase family DNA binding protein
MLTVPEAARRTQRNPETIRRWIREGKLRATKVGTQHVIEERDLDDLLEASSRRLPIPPDWEHASWGGPTPDVVGAVRRSRATALATLIAEGRVTPALDPDTESLPTPAASSSRISATATLLAERDRDER